jgi:hypothetical protein
MHRIEERETVALSSLHDISDYSSYIDQRISKLNNLYESLTLPSNDSRNRKRSLVLSRQNPPQILSSTHVQRILKARESLLASKEQMYKTDYLPKRGRYQLDDSPNSEQIKSLTLSNFRNSIDVSRGRFHDEKKPNKKLEIYKQIKNDILGTFYVGGRTISQSKKNSISLAAE